MEGVDVDLRRGRMGARRGRCDRLLRAGAKAVRLVQQPRHSMLVVVGERQVMRKKHRFHGLAGARPAAGAAPAWGGGGAAATACPW